MQPRDTPPARPIFRRLALGLAVICLALAIGLAFLVPDEGWFAPGVCVFVGVVMATIAATGRWPPRDRR